MAEFLQSWEDRIPMGVVLNETEEAALKVMKEVFGIPSSTVYDGIQYAILAHRYKELMHGADERVFQSGAEDQIARLAAFIMNNVPSEPHRGNEGAGDCAIRIIRELQDQVRSLRSQLSEMADEELLKENRAWREEPPL